jgi:hypothetical protein
MSEEKLKSRYVCGRPEIYSPLEDTNFVIAEIDPDKQDDIKAEYYLNRICQCVNNYDSVRKQRDALLDAAKIGLGYVESSDGCSKPDCTVCAKKRTAIKTIRETISQVEAKK